MKTLMICVCRLEFEQRTENMMNLFSAFFFGLFYETFVRKGLNYKKCWHAIITFNFHTTTHNQYRSLLFMILFYWFIGNNMHTILLYLFWPPWGLASAALVNLALNFHCKFYFQSFNLFFYFALLFAREWACIISPVRSTSAPSHIFLY